MDGRNTFLAFIGGAIAWALFGDKIKEKVNTNDEYLKLKSEVEEKIENIGEVSRQKYYAIVDEVAGKYAKAKGLQKNEIRDLVDDLKMHWSRIRSAWNKSDNSGSND